MKDSIIYALDFDGVICDSAIETGMSGWKAARQIWNDMPEQAPTEMIELFRQVRPIIETGYEAILTMRMLFLNEAVDTIYNGYLEEFDTLMQQAQVDVNTLKTLFGNTRDAWIADNKADWIQKNPLFPGVAEKLALLNKTATWYVITTKQERFVKKIFAANHIELAEDRIFGLDRNMSKPEVLKIVQKYHPNRLIYFVEDRLPALIKVKQEPEFSAVQLHFATWGYNCADDKAKAKDQGFNHLTLTDFLS